jgi:hypothetical protein
LIDFKEEQQSNALESIISDMISDQQLHSPAPLISSLLTHNLIIALVTDMAFVLCFSAPHIAPAGLTHPPLCTEFGVGPLDIYKRNCLEMHPQQQTRYSPGEQLTIEMYNRRHQI